MIFDWILTLGILAGQLIKLPLFDFGGLITLDLITVLLIFLGAVNLRFKFKKPPAVVSAGFIFILVTFASLVLTPLHLAALQYLISALYPLRLLSYLILAWIISGGFKKIDIHQTLITTGVLLSVIAVAQFILLPDLRFLESNGWDPHYFRAVSTFLDPNFLGAFLVIPLVLMLHKFVINRRNLIYFLLIFTALALTFSRSSYLMFFISTLILGLKQRSKKIISTAIILTAVLLISFHLYTEVISKPRNIDRGKSASFRLNTWQQGIDLFQKSPTFGIGFNSYRFALKEYELADQDFLKSHGSSSNDSSLLFVVATTGAVGLISYLVLLFLIARQNFISLSLILGLVTESFFNNSLFYPPIILSLLLISISEFSKR